MAKGLGLWQKVWDYSERFGIVAKGLPLGGEMFGVVCERIGAGAGR